MIVIPLLIFQLVCLTCEGRFKIWIRQGQNKNLMYGIIVRKNVTFHQANEMCQSVFFNGVPFNGLATVRNEEESGEWEEVVNYYRNRNETFLNESISDYWMGTLFNYTVKKWIHYDGVPAEYTNWFSGFPNALNSSFCVIANFNCSNKTQVCTLKWQNRVCGDGNNISRIVCEKRENIIAMNQVEELLNKYLQQNQTNFSLAETIVQNILQISRQSGLNNDVISDGIRFLALLAKQADAYPVSELTVATVLKILQYYQDFVLKSNSLITLQERQSLIRTFERLLNAVIISENRTSTTFNTTTIFAQVLYLDEESVRDYKFTAPEPNGVEVTVSQDAVERRLKTSKIGNRSRISFVRYQNNELFQSRFNATQVISVQIDGQNITGLSVPIKYSIPINLKLNHTDVLYVQCVSWNFSLSSWSNEGCWLLSHNSKPICACNHLTNFALLVEIFRRPAYYIFDSINRCIGAASCVGFFLVVVIYAKYTELRNSKPGRIHINLCFCYFTAYAIFLAGSNTRDESLLCLTVTVLSHYFFLAGWFWTFIEALTMYCLLVKKWNFLGDTYYGRSLLFSYFVPFLIVAMNVAITVGYIDRQPINGFFRVDENNFLYNSTYVSNHACWLTSYSLYFGFLGIGGALMSMNVVIYGIVLRSINWRNRKIKSSRSESSFETFKQVVSIGLLLGVVWVFAVPMELLAISPIFIAPVTYAFSSLIAIQGIMIFYLFCIRHEKARKLWWYPIKRKSKRCWGWICCYKQGIFQSFYNTKACNMCLANSQSHIIKSEVANQRK